MNSLSPAGKRNVIRPLIPREMKTRGGEVLLPEKLRDFFALRLAASNALQRLLIAWYFFPELSCTFMTSGETAGH